MSKWNSSHKRRCRKYACRASLAQMFSQPFSTLWRKGLVSLPRLVPDRVLKYTSSEGPQPFVIKLPSRGNYLIPVYVWVPPSICTTALPIDGLPVLVDFHGGSFVYGSCQEQAVFCAKFARELDILAISVDYRLGPYAKFPAAIEDAEDILKILLNPSSDGHKQLLQSIRDHLPRLAAREGKRAKNTPSGAISQENLKSPTMVDEASRSSLSLSQVGNSMVPVSAGMTNSDNSLKPPLPKSVNSIRPPLSKRSSSYRSYKKEGSPYSSKSDIALQLFINTNKIALSGFSSGGNLALNLALSVPATPPYLPTPWPTLFPSSHVTPIPVLLFYPSFDCRQLPSERPRPPAMGEPSKGFFSNLAIDNILMPTYLPRELSGHPRASPGLAAVVAEKDDSFTGLHEHAAVALVVPELDTLAAQGEEWIQKVYAAGRKEKLAVRRYPEMKHGWTQFPDFALGEKEKIDKYDAFEFVANFVRDLWQLPIPSPDDQTPTT